MPFPSGRQVQIICSSDATVVGNVSFALLLTALHLYFKLSSNYQSVPPPFYLNDSQTFGSLLQEGIEAKIVTFVPHTG